MRRAWWLVLGVILVVAAVLRLEGIGAHLSDAEGYSYLVGSASSAGAFLRRLAAYENTPPLFYLLLTPLPLGHTVWLRIPAAIPGALIPLALYAALRRPLGARAALLAAAIAAVAPFAVSYSDYARGFMLEGLACILALWAMLRLADGASPRWWLLYLGAGVVAVYAEYDAIVLLVALTIAAVAWGGRSRLRTGVLGLLPLASLLPWAGQFERAQDALNHTKVSPTFPGPSLSSLRDVTDRLVLGEHGAGAGAVLRWLEFVALVAVLAAVLLILRRARAADPSSERTRAVLWIATTGALIAVGHALAPLFGTEIFNERYLTVLLPLGAALIAAAVAEVNARWLWRAAVAVVAIVGVAVLVQRFGREYEPDLAPVRTAVVALDPRTVLTNSAVVAYYLRRLPVVVDRPFGLGPGRERSCAQPCVIVDDARVPGGARPGPGPSRLVGPFVVRLAAGG
ncbi:MAG: glycosyltransferase family 39 protein [Actinomycetota bacterium]|nr:glycosyltransferase family 39 protein [Actinomycetota bacterium]